MLLIRLLEYGLVVQQLLGAWVQTIVFIVGMRLQELMLRQTITDEVSFVCVGDVWCLMVDGVEALERVMDHAHVASASYEHVLLQTWLASCLLRSELTPTF